MNRKNVLDLGIDISSLLAYWVGIWSVGISVSLSIHLLIFCQSVHLSVHSLVCTSICMSISAFIHLLVYLYIIMPVSTFIHPLVYLYDHKHVCNMVGIYSYTPAMSGMNLPGVVKGFKIVVLSGCIFSHLMYFQTSQMMHLIM